MNGILLTATISTNDLITYGIGIIIIGLMGYFIYSKYKKDPNGEAKLNEFFNNIQDIIKEHIIEVIESFDFNNIEDSFNQAQAEFLEDVYNDIWNLCSLEIEKLADTDTILYALLKKTITKEKIEDYVLTILSEDSFMEKLADIYNIALKDKIKEIEEEDKKHEKEVEYYENNIIDTESVPELDPTKIPGVEDEFIVPPVEDEEEFVSSNDPTIEVLLKSEQNVNIDLDSVIEDKDN